MEPTYVLLFLLSVSVSADEDGIFTSNIDLQKLITTEQEIIDALRNYIEVEDVRVNKMKAVLDSYEKMHWEATLDAEKFVSNPLNAFLLIKRLTADWKEVREIISPRGRENVMDHLANRTVERMLRWPSDEDLSGAAVALTRLQDTYNLRPGDMSEGRLSGKSFGTRMTANDCFELGRQSYNNGDHQHAIQWMDTALKKLKREDKPSVDKASVYEYLAFAFYSEGSMEEALLYTNKLLQLEPEHPRAVGNKAYYEEHIAKKTENKKGDDGSSHENADHFPVGKWDGSMETDTEKYKRLCRDGGERDEVRRTRLKCHYARGKHPYLTLMPYKEEVVSLTPKISIFYHVLSDREMESIKELATPRFRRATVQNSVSGELETASYRISKTSWLQRSENEHTKHVYQRVADITGLNMETSEELQVSNYGMGGHYDPHFDFATSKETNAFKSLGTGNRIATWLFYLSDVDLGGATVFPRANLTLLPKRGSAVFWYNLHRNGEGDTMTRHAACPVLTGTKWVSNFWIHERGQEFTHPCTTDPFS